MQLWQYCLLVPARSLYMFRTLSAPIIRSTKTCSNSHCRKIHPGAPRVVDPWIKPFYIIGCVSLTDLSTCCYNRRCSNFMFLISGIRNAIQNFQVQFAVKCTEEGGGVDNGKFISAISYRSNCQPTNSTVRKTCCSASCIRHCDSDSRWSFTAEVPG
jgi:hypothetical protein